MTLHGRRNLDSGGGIDRRIVRDWQDGDDGRVARFALNREYDHAGAIFAPFVLSGLMFVVP